MDSFSLHATFVVETSPAPPGLIARLQLARALVLSGETAKGKSAYNDLFALWKDADPDARTLQEARLEEQKLK